MFPGFPVYLHRPLSVEAVSKICGTTGRAHTSAGPSASCGEGLSLGAHYLNGNVYVK